jgi:hypothetical protein
VSPTDRIVTTPDGKHPNAGKTNLCTRCGGDPLIAIGAAAIGTPGCICGVKIGQVPTDDVFTDVTMPATIRAHAKLDPRRFAFERSETPERVVCDAFDGRVFHTSGRWVVIEPASGAATHAKRFAQGVAVSVTDASRRLGTITRSQIEAARNANAQFRHAVSSIGGELFDAHVALDLFDVAGWSNDAPVEVFTGHAKAASNGPLAVDTMAVFRFERDGTTIILAGLQYALPVTIEVTP